ncbi:MAG: hypothetical protein ACYTGR_10395 [Planctomycetota bacterium]
MLRTIFVTVILGGAALGGIWWFGNGQQQKIIDDLRELNERVQAEAEAQRQMVERLKREHRLAHIHVLSQVLADDGTVVETTIEFIELDDDGTELGRQRFNVPGQTPMIDVWTIKFESGQVASGHPLMGRSLVLLRRVYSEHLRPADGIAIDTPGAVPPGYAVGEVGAFQRRLWGHFWEIATDVEMARSMGVRVAQGEVVYKPMKRGERYELRVDADGGMNLMPLELTTGDAGDTSPG